MHVRLAALIALLLIPVTVHAAQPVAADHFETSVRPVLVEHCSACHDPGDPDNVVKFLAAESPEDVAQARSLWSSVAEQLQNRTMPPADEPQPSEADRLRIAGWIDDWLHATACQQGETVGHVVTRRLNRDEYHNTIRDLVGLETDFVDTFPTDGGGGEGFDNNGETLYLPPLLMERYLEAAQQIVDRAIITPAQSHQFVANELLPSIHKPGNEPRRLEPGEEVAALVRVYVPAEYHVRILLSPPTSGEGKLVLKIDGIASQRFNISRPEDLKKEQPDVITLQADVHLTRGTHVVSLRVPPKAKPAIPLTQLDVSEVRTTVWEEQRPVHNRLMRTATIGEPANKPADEQSDMARSILSHFTQRAFRRPVREAELDRLLSLYDRAALRRDPFEESIKLALKAVLVSPHFLFRIEDVPGDDGVEPSGIEPISDYELASRLSYFLWASMPDDELFRLAEEGRLHEDDVLTAQVDRMLDDPKSRAFAEAFIGQWLGTREVGGRVAPDTNFFKPAFYNDLPVQLREEVNQLMMHLIREDRAVMELINADYTFLNERLAKHYGIKGVKGDRFRKVTLEDDRRGGVLGLGAVHMLTSRPRRTSPVLRGAWVLDTLLGTKVPSPPADVPALKEKGKQVNHLTTREKPALHRDNPTCAACHDLMDPIGFGLENFDVLGRWRDEENKKPIDSAGTLPSGETFNGPAQLRAVLLQREDRLVQTISEKMLGYALGRSLVDSDQCTVQKLAERLDEADGRVRALVKGIVLSRPFRYRELVSE